MTKNTQIGKYLAQDEDGKFCSLYSLLVGKIPVVTCSSTYATWPRDENNCKTMLLLHWPTWRKISDIKEEITSWSDAMHAFLEYDACPNFIKADVRRAQSHNNATHDNESDSEKKNGIDPKEHPEWMDLIRPNADFYDQILHDDFVYDDGESEYYWSNCSAQYQNDFEK